MRARVQVRLLCFKSAAVCVLLTPHLTSNPPAMYSVQIKVERDRVTGETRVLSANTTLPVDLSLHGVKVYEDELKGDDEKETGALREVPR